MSKGNGDATLPAGYDDDRRTVGGFWSRWGSAITTAGSVALSLFVLWHQIELSLEMQAQRIASLTRQVEIMQTQIDRLEARIYEHTVSDAARATR